MLSVNGRSFSIRQILQSDISILWRWRNDELFMSLCSTRRNQVTKEEFEAELAGDLKRDRFLQCLIVKNNQPVGTLYGYGLNRTDGNAFFTTYVSSEYERSGAGAEGSALFVKYIFDEFNLFKLYVEVYSYNIHSLSCLTSAGFVEEGVFKGHRLLKGERYDLIRLAFFRESVPRLERFVRRLAVSGSLLS